MSNFETEAAESFFAATQIFGEIAWLNTQSHLHREWPIKTLEKQTLPAILTKQMRLYHNEGKPIGYVSWAYLSKEVETAYAKNPLSLQPKDWRSGDRLWCIDFIAPFGHAKSIIRDLRNSVFKNEVARALRLYRNSDGARIIYLHGAKAVKQSQDKTYSPDVEIL